jgi:hypothetical protein
MHHLLAMQDYLLELWDFHIWTVIAVAGAILSAISIFADRRRHRRARIEQVGFMPWTGISVFAIMVTLMATALAIKAG